MTMEARPLQYIAEATGGRVTQGDGGTFVQYTERDKEGVPTNQSAASNILAGIAGVQVDLSKCGRGS